MTFGIMPRVPVVMYHAIGEPAPGLLWPELACPEELFRSQLQQLDSCGYQAAGLDEIRFWQDRGRGPDQRTVVFTFDDGYLDTWVLGAPLLQQHGFRGTVYVNPDFIEPGEEVRPTLADVWAGRVAREDLQVHGYLNWPEVRMLDQQGIIEVASHSRTHTWYEVGPQIQGFVGGDAAPPWLAWNLRPDRKYAWLGEDQSSLVPAGTPIYVAGRSLGVRRWLPDPRIAEATTRHVVANGGAEFFRRGDWRATLLRTAEAADSGEGRWETDAEMIRRYRDEIFTAEEQLSAQIGRPLRHFAWPGGASCDASWEVIWQGDYRTITVSPTDRRRWHDPDPRYLRRVVAMDWASLRGRRFRPRDPRLLLLACEELHGVPAARFRFHLRKLWSWLRARGR